MSTGERRVEFSAHGFSGGGLLTNIEGISPSRLVTSSGVENETDIHLPDVSPQQAYVVNKAGM